MISDKLILAQLADPQIGFNDYDGELARFQREIDMLNGSLCQAAVVCGDMMHHTTRESLMIVKREFDRLRMPVYLVAGNHDVCQDGARQVFTELFGPTYYAVDLPGKEYRLVVVDSNLWQVPDARETPTMDAFLLRELADANVLGKRVIMAMHSPIFIESMAEKEEYFNLPKARRAWLMETLAAYPVVACLTGHTHTAFATMWRGILFSSGETTSVAFDKVNYGYRKLVFDGDMVRFAAVPVSL